MYIFIIYIYYIYIYLYLLQVDFLLKSSTKPFGPELRPERGQLVHARLPALEPRLRGKRSNASFPFMTLLKLYINKMITGKNKRRDFFLVLRACSEAASAWEGFSHPSS